MEGCGMSCIKYLLFAFNLLFLLCGIGIIVAGSLAFVHINYDIVIGKGPAIALIVLGVIIVIISFLGCCGAIKESNGMLISFAVILILIFIAQLAIVITAAVYKDTIQDNLKKSLEESMTQYSDFQENRDAWDSIQQDLECCGVDNYGDWQNRRQPLPASCCDKAKSIEEIKGQLCTETVPKYQEGCYRKLEEIFKKSQDIIIGVGVGIALIEVAGAILACFLAKAIRKENGEEGG